MTPHRLRALGAASGLLLLVLCGCSSDTDVTPAQPSEAAGQPAESPQAAEPAQPTDADVTQAVEVRPSDLPGTFGSKELFGDRGDVVDGTVSLDLCGADFPSEALRTARHQVAYAAADELSVSTESVAYEPGGAAQAMDELGRAVATCPKGFVDSAVAGQPDLKLRYQALTPEPDWQEGTLALRVDLTPKGQASVSGVVIYQTRGDLVAGVYAWAGPRETAGSSAAQRLATRVASLVSARLEASAPATGVAS